MKIRAKKNGATSFPGRVRQDAVHRASRRRRFSFWSKRLFGIAALIGLFFESPCWIHAADPEPIGEQAEREGRLKDAFDECIQALPEVKPWSDEDVALRAKIIRLTQRLSPAPKIPKSAKEFLLRGREQFNDATYPQHFQVAAQEFAETLLVAPWWGEAYSRMAATQQNLGHFADAAKSLKLFLLAEPDSTSVEKVKTILKKLPEQEAKAQADRQAQEQRAKQEFMSPLSGTWKREMNDAEYRWQLRVIKDQQFELVPFEVRDLVAGTKQVLTKNDSGYFICSVDGTQIVGNAISARGPQGRCRSETVNLKGELRDQGKILLLSYTFYMNQADCSLLHKPARFECRFVHID